MKKITNFLHGLLPLATFTKNNGRDASYYRISSLQASPGNGHTYTYLYTYDNAGRVSSQTEKIGSFETKYLFSYGNGGQVIMKNIFNSAAGKDSFELNRDGNIIYRVYHFTRGYSHFYYSYDEAGFLIAETYEAFIAGNRVPFANEQKMYINTVDNGNLVKRVTVAKNLKTGITGAVETHSWEYDERKVAFPAFFSANHTGYEFLGRGYGKCSKNAVIAANSNGVAYNYTYQVDARGRLNMIYGTNTSGGDAYCNQQFVYTYTSG